MMINLLWIVPLAAVVSLACTYLYISHAARKLPNNNPQSFLPQIPQNKKKVIVCIGDSNTHGRVCCNYVDILAAKSSLGEFATVNAGINSHLAWNVLQRIDEIIACQPNIVTILIGSNDANATLTEKNMKRYQKLLDLPCKPNRLWYHTNLKEIINILKIRTKAKIALISLPPIGEDTDHTAYRRVIDYSSIVMEIAEKENVAYIPLSETFDDYLKAHPNQPRISYDDDPRKLRYGSLLGRYLLRRKWNDISRRRGLLLLTDTLHLNCTAADIVANLIEKFICEITD